MKTITSYGRKTSPNAKRDDTMNTTAATRNITKNQAQTNKNDEEYSSMPSPEHGPIMLHPNDVLFGRGKDTSLHPGNQRFRSFVDEEKPHYVSMKTRKEKTAIVNSIIQRVYSLDPPGRFLESVEDEGRKNVGGDGVTVALLRSLQCHVGVSGSEEKAMWKLAEKSKIMTKTRKALSYIPASSGDPKKSMQEATGQTSNNSIPAMASREEKVDINTEALAYSNEKKALPPATTCSDSNIEGSLPIKEHHQAFGDEKPLATYQTLQRPDVARLHHFQMSQQQTPPLVKTQLDLAIHEDFATEPKESSEGQLKNDACYSDSIYESDASNDDWDDDSVREIDSIAMESFPTDGLSTGASTLESLTIGSLATMSLTSDGNTVQREESNKSTTDGSLTIGSSALMSLSTGEKDNMEGIHSIVHESLTTRVLYVRDSKRMYGGNTDYVAIKMLVDQYPGTEQKACLENEYNISQHLGSCKSTRNAVKNATAEGYHAIYLEWAEGTTLREWIKSTHSLKVNTVSTSAHDNMNCDVESEKDFDYESIIRLALVISKAIEEIHQLNVVHNNLTTDNIIVNVDKDDGNFSVKIIDFGSALIVENNDNDEDYIAYCKQNDIISLAAVYYDLFTRKNSSRYDHSDISPASYTTNDEGKSNQLPYDVISLINSKVPLCLSVLVLNLRKSVGPTSFYHAMAEVVLDLEHLLDKGRKFYLGTENEKNMGRLKISKNHLYGRDDHLRVLVDAYERVSLPSGKSEVVLISGYSGTGKSALVQHFRHLLPTNDSNFLLGKFDIFQEVEPLSAIIAALTNFCKELVAKDDESSLRTKANIKKALGSDSGTLEHLLPDLRKITGAPTESIANVGGKEAQNRLKYLFRLLVRAIASPNQPMVLCLDDIQWIDPASLELMTSLITDVSNRSLLLIGLYRQNEVSESHPLYAQVKSIETKVVTNRIRVDNLDRTQVNDLISDTLEMSPFSTQSLADAVYRKTSGNALFVVQFIRSLYEEGVLSFSFRTEEWQWETKTINSINLSHDTVKLMSRKVLSFPKEAQSALKMMACLGSLSEELMKWLVVGKELDIKKVKSNECFNICRDLKILHKWLEFSVSEGLIDHASTRYNFAHDQIQVAVYSLIPDDEKGLWHLQIGTQILTNKTVTTEQNIFVAVGQLNRGASFVTEKKQRIELARLNLQAGGKAISSATYPLAASFLEEGINMLDEKCWEETYDLSLQLYSSFVETCYCNGHFDKMEKALGVTNKFARSFSDKYPTYLTQIRALAAQTKTFEAIKVGLCVLKELGEHFPTSLNKEVVIAEFMKTKQALEGKTESDILELRAADNDEKIAAIEVLKLISLVSTTNESSADIGVLFSFRLVQLSLCYGLSGEAAIGFISYAYVLRGSFDDIKGAYRYGQIASRLVERFRVQGLAPFVNSCVYGVINSWVDHHKSSIEPLKYAYKLGMRCGDVQVSALCAMQFCIFTFQCGENLETVIGIMDQYCDELLELKQELYGGNLQVWRQTVLNLMGRSDDPLKLAVGAIDQNFLVHHAICHNLSWLGYLFGNYELASKMADKCQLMIDNSCSPLYTVGNHAFVHSLISLALARTAGQNTSTAIADNTIEKMNGWVGLAPSNWEHKLLLLQAEKSNILGLNDDAEIKYDMAIKKAGENGFMQEQAIAYELAGSFYFARGVELKASQLYGQAHETYLKWGAHGKADHLRLNFPF